MVYLRAGSVVQQPSYLDELLSLPMRIYQFLLFFFTTLIDPHALTKGGKTASGKRWGSVHGTRPSGGGGGGGGGSGGGGNKRPMGRVGRAGSSSMPPGGG
mmetsp:Transcript_40934/g.101763  ORF Transcript_40934/g.101763 Transcript_40934/m.101763 type:complete len:100 (+) Transcript_40934:66-365(+)